ncbi:dihydroneopterin aldolase [Halopseudomonas salina]|uniref:7,8-dihydroneopterin aldolase n=1 Tax=Halopseudomonas salina TaxID=1323744 RepID=A0ABQ1P536_9GAMM|nr:dihydroneopterin aldolase [Halopseudomonas salina]GGC90746.1 7,8-dihydroneopterin aldolase [Halopseudomonas salina]
MDQVFIKGLSVEAVIGVYDWERTILQPLVLDLDLGWDIRAAAAGDDLSATLDYAAVSQRVLEYVGTSQFQLVESLAERLAALIMEEFSVPWLRLRVTKPGAVSEASGGVGVLIERGVRTA